MSEQKLEEIRNIRLEKIKKLLIHQNPKKGLKILLMLVRNWNRM